MAATTLLLALALAAPAAAERHWLAPQEASLYPAQSASAAVSGDGTMITAALRQDGLAELRAGTATRFVAGVGDIRVTAGGDHELVAAWDAAGEVQAVTAGPDGFGSVTDLGPGALAGLAADEAGDASVLITGTEVRTAYRAAGGAFGAAVTVPDLTTPAAAIGGGLGTPFALAVAGGHTLVARAYRDVRVAERDADGPVSPARTVAQDGPGTDQFPSFINPRVALASDGRALVFYGRLGPGLGEYHLVSAHRDASGGWSSGPELPGASAGQVYDAAADEHGDVVVAFVPGYGQHVQVAAGAVDALGAPAELDVGGTPDVAVAPDGSALVIGDRAARRDGLGAFAAPRVATCGDPLVAAGFSADDAAVLATRDDHGYGLTTSRDAPGAGPDISCPNDVLSLPVLAVSPAPVHIGEPALLRLQTPPVPGILDVLATDWDLDGVPGYEEHTDGSAVTHTFSRLGWQQLYARVAAQRPDGTRFRQVGAPTVYVGPQLSLRVIPDPRRVVLRRGLRIRLSTSTPEAAGMPVFAYLGSLMGQWFSLPPRPTTIRIPLRPGARRMVRRSLSRKRLKFEVSLWLSRPTRWYTPPELLSGVKAYLP